MTTLSETSGAKAWLDNVDDESREPATDMLNEILLVSGDDFAVVIR